VLPQFVVPLVLSTKLAGPQRRASCKLALNYALDRCSRRSS